MEHIDHSDWLRGSRPEPSGLSYATRDLNDIPLRDRLPEVLTRFDTKRILSQTKWVSPSHVQNERPEDEKDKADDELRKRQPEQYVKKYHKIIMERARNRSPAHLMSPNGLTDIPTTMQDSIEGSGLILKPYQLSGAGEMLYLESIEPYGGILADEMGLGKTVQMIALICASLDIEEEDPINPKPTLIIVPKSLLPMWIEQLETWANRLMVLRYHGSNRKKSINYSLFTETNITITTYGEVMSEYKDYRSINLAFQEQANHDGDLKSIPQLPPRNSRILPLYTTQWHRVILEEAHIPRNTSNLTFKSVHFLQAQKRWAITGTPFMNDYTDIQSLLKFLRVKPWCSDHLFREHFIKDRSDRVTSDFLTPLRNKVLVATFQSLAIRRERGSIFDGRPIINTQGLAEFDITLALDDGTRFGSPAFHADKYLTEQECQTRYEPLWEEDGDYDSDVTEEELNTFRLYTFMLMAAIHYASPSGGYSDLSEDEQHKQMGLTSGGKNKNAEPAPTHRTLRTKFKDQIRRLEHTWHSTKIDECVSIIEKNVRDDDAGKILVFCEYMTCLDILSMALEEKGIPHADLNGQMTLPERTNIVQMFQDEDDQSMPKVLLITSQCGSYGLTLTAASTVILLNNSWTPLNDAQCIARANRIGQKRVVNVYRLHVQRSMEEKKAMIAREKNGKFNELMTNTRAIDEDTADEEFEELLNFYHDSIGKVDLLGLREPEDDDDDDGIDFQGLPFSSISKGVLTIIINPANLFMADGDFPVFWTEQGLPMGFNIADGYAPLPPRDEETDEDPANEQAVSQEAQKKDKIITYDFEVFEEGSRALTSCSKKNSKKRAIEERQSDEGSELGTIRKKRRQLRQRSIPRRRPNRRRLHRILSTSTEGSASEPKPTPSIFFQSSPSNDRIPNRDAVEIVPAKASPKSSSREDSSSEDHSTTDYEKDYEVDSILDAAMGEQEMWYKVHWKGYRSSKDTWEPKSGLGNCRATIRKFHREHPDIA